MCLEVFCGRVKTCVNANLFRISRITINAWGLFLAKEICWNKACQTLPCLQMYFQYVISGIIHSSCIWFTVSLFEVLPNLYIEKIPFDTKGRNYFLFVGSCEIIILKFNCCNQLFLWVVTCRKEEHNGSSHFYILGWPDLWFSHKVCSLCSYME